MDNPKTITVSNEDVLDTHNALMVLTQQKLKVSLAHRLALCLRPFKQQRDTVNELRETLLDEYAEHDADGRKIVGEINRRTGLSTWKMENEEGFNEAWKELLAQEVQVTLYPVKMEQFGKKFEIEPVNLEALLRGGVIEIEEKTEKDEDE